MSKIHLFAHMDKNFVKEGDKVLKYVTPIGTVGDGNGAYYAHLHFSISHDLEPLQLYGYISGWPKAQVEMYYEDPKDVDFQKMFGRKMDVGNFGYDWLDWVGYGYHPGVDVNGLGGGNSDFGYAFKSSCDGTVVYEDRTWFRNGGWGNLIMIEEDVITEPPELITGYNLKKELDKEVQHSYWMGEGFDDRNPDQHIKLAEKLKSIRKKYDK